MDPLVIALLEKERICVLSVVMKDGSPHASVVHYSQTIDPVRIFIQTYPTTKTKLLRGKVEL